MPENQVIGMFCHIRRDAVQDINIPNQWQPGIICMRGRQSQKQENQGGAQPFSPNSRISVTTGSANDEWRN